MYVIAKHGNSPDAWNVVFQVTIKASTFETIPCTDLSVQYITVTDYPAYVDDLLGALVFEYPEQAYSLLTVLGLSGYEIIGLSVIHVDL